jgi:hypothetical protein
MIMGGGSPNLFKQAVLVIRWLLDATRVRQLAVDNAIGKTTAYDRGPSASVATRCRR